MSVPPDDLVTSETGFLHMGIDVLAEVVMKSTIFWDITSCSPLKVNRCFGTPSTLSSTSNIPRKIQVWKQVASRIIGQPENFGLYGTQEGNGRLDLSSQWLTMGHNETYGLSHDHSFSCLLRVRVTLQLTVRLGVEPCPGLMTRYLFFFESYCLVYTGRPFWREDGSIGCQSQSVVIGHCQYIT
jgi:hypothetical protein